MENEKFISFRVPIELAEQAKQRAKTQHRSLQGHMLHLIENDLAKSQQKSSSKASKVSPVVGVKSLRASENFVSTSSTAMKKTSRPAG
jgi:hypothetical protein